MDLLHNQRGQFAIEGILLMVVLVGVFMTITKLARDSKLIPKIVTDPWAQVAGMTETGQWKAPTAATRVLHPNSNERAYTKNQEGQGQ